MYFIRWKWLLNSLINDAFCCWENISLHLPDIIYRLHTAKPKSAKNVHYQDLEWENESEVEKSRLRKLSLKLYSKNSNNCVQKEIMKNAEKKEKKKRGYKLNWSNRSRKNWQEIELVVLVAKKQYRCWCRCYILWVRRKLVCLNWLGFSGAIVITITETSGKPLVELIILLVSSSQTW